MSLLNTHLWLLDYDLIKSPPILQFDRLKPPQKQRALKLYGKRKFEFYLSRLLLNHAIDQLLLRVDDNSWYIQEQEQLPPVISHHEYTISTSISHTNGVIGVIVALVQSPVKLGLDIEIIRPNLNQKTAAFFCNKQQLAEATTLQHSYEKQQYFTRLWTQKEAYFKAHETPILNKDIQTLELAHDKNIYCASIDNNVELSIYCENLISIKSHSVIVRDNGEIKSINNSKLNRSLY